MKKKIGGADEPQPQPEAELLPPLHVAYPGGPEVHVDWLKIAEETTFKGITRYVLPPGSLGFISAHGVTAFTPAEGPKYTVIPENINIIFYSEGGGLPVAIASEVDENRYSYYRGGALCEDYFLQPYPGYEKVGSYTMRGVYANDIKIQLTGGDNIIADIKRYCDRSRYVHRQPNLTPKMRESFEAQVSPNAENPEDVVEEMKEQWDDETAVFDRDAYKRVNARLFDFFYADPWGIINMTEPELRPELTKDESTTLAEICDDEGPEMKSNPTFTWNGPKRKFSDILKLLSEKKHADPSLPGYYICNFCRSDYGQVKVGMEPLSKCGELYGEHELGLDASELSLLSTTAVELPGELRRDSSLASSNALNYFREILDELLDYGNHDMPWYGRLLEICEQITTPAVAGHVITQDDVYLDRDQVCFVLQLRHTLSMRAV